MKKMTKTMLVPRKRSKVFVLSLHWFKVSTSNTKGVVAVDTLPNNSILIRFLRINVSFLMHRNVRRTDFFAHMLWTRGGQQESLEAEDLGKLTSHSASTSSGAVGISTSTSSFPSSVFFLVAPPRSFIDVLPFVPQARSWRFANQV